MRILIITGIFPPDIGGPATYVPQIATALAERGHAITVITLSDRTDIDDSTYPFQIVRLPRKVFKPWRWIYTVTKVIQLGRRADLLFVNGLAMEAVLANLSLRKPMVQKVVGDLAWERAISKGWVDDNFEDFQKRRYGVRVEILKALRAWWTRKADKVIVPSRYLARWVAGWGVKAERIEVVYNAIEIPDGVKPVEVPLKTPLKLVTVGRLVPWKHVDKMIGTIAQLDNVGLVIVGDGPERKYLEELARMLSVADRVYFAGQRSKAETLALMASCDIFVLNSTYEGFPHVVLEAMALGLSVVATAVGGTPEIMKDGENGMLISAEDHSLSAVLEQLARDPLLRQRLGQGARCWVREHFSLERMIEKTEEILLAMTKGECKGHYM